MMAGSIAEERAAGYAARISLLLPIMTPATFEIVERRLENPGLKRTVENFADWRKATLYLEMLNPYRPLTTEEKAELEGVSQSALSKRKGAK